MSLYLAVDGGATKTIAAVYSESLEILGLGVSGPSNYRNVGESVAIENLNEAVSKAIISSGYTAENIKSSSYAIAGVKDSELATRTVGSIVSRTRIHPNYTLYNDGEAGFHSRFLGGDGIIVAPGTGMIAFCRYKGRMERSSGWGWFVGDEGGAFYIGKRSISKFAQMSDHREEMDEAFHDAISRFFDIDTDRGITDRIYDAGIDIRKIASLASIVSRLSNQGNENCSKILKEAAVEAARCAIALHGSMNVTSGITLSGYGGVYRAGSIYWDTLKMEVKKFTRKVSFLDPIYGYHAVSGSILLKLAEVGNQVGVADAENLVHQIDGLVMAIPEEDRKRYLFM